MADFKNSVLACALLALVATGPAFAQETGTATEGTDTQTEGTAPTTQPAGEADAGAGAGAGEDLPLGEAVGADENIGRAYTTETHGDWEIRCIRSADGNDPCQLYQLLKDENDNSVAEISMFPLPEGQQAVAGATIAVPLETLLPQQLTLAVDNGQARRYPFTWCSQAGCFARLGFTGTDIAAFKRGVSATLTIVPVAAPNSKVNLKVSLTGFTAGFAAVSAKTGN